MRYIILKELLPSLKGTTDYDETGEPETGDFSFIIGGVTNLGKGFALITRNSALISIGTSALEFTQISSPTQKGAGFGLYDASGNYNVGTANTARIVINQDDIDLATVSTPVTDLTAGNAKFISHLNVDVYGRVIGVTSNTHTLATSSVKGIASST